MDSHPSGPGAVARVAGVVAFGGGECRVRGALAG
jgi:hypothetical protein